MSELSEIFAALGRLEEQGDESQRQRRRLFKKVDDMQDGLAGLGASVGGMEPRIAALEHAQDNEIKPAMEDYKRTKAKGAGLLLGVGLGGGALGAHVDKGWAAVKSFLGL